MFYRYTYLPSPKPFLFQGTEAALNKKLKSAPNLYVISGGNGSYVIGGYSSGCIYEYADATSQRVIRSVCPNKENMRTRYGKTRITERDYMHLTDELNSGIITFDSLL